MIDRTQSLVMVHVYSNPSSLALNTAVDNYCWWLLVILHNDCYPENLSTSITWQIPLSQTIVVVKARQVPYRGTIQRCLLRQI